MSLNHPPPRSIMACFAEPHPARLQSLGSRIERSLAMCQFALKVLAGVSVQARMEVEGTFKW